MYTYDPYGVLTGSAPTGIAAGNPFRYDGGYETPSGLYHFGARYYDPTAERWTQLDPSKASSGYVYAGDDPVNAIDPTGTTTAPGDDGGVLNSLAFACALSLAAAICAFINPGAVPSPDEYIQNVVTLEEEQVYYSTQLLEDFYSTAEEVTEDLGSAIESQVESDFASVLESDFASVI